MPRHSVSDPTMPASAKRATNVTLPAALLVEAKDLGVNLSQASARGIAAEIAERKAQRWREANAERIAQWNAHTDQNGLPLANLRQF